MAVGRGRSSASATDTVARTSASAALTTAQTIARPPGATIAPGEYTFTGGYIYSNETAAPLTMPATTDKAAMLAAGFVESDSASVDEVVLSTSDLSGTAPAGAKVGRNVTTGRDGVGSIIGGADHDDGQSPCPDGDGTSRHGQRLSGWF